MARKTKAEKHYKKNKQLQTSKIVAQKKKQKQNQLKEIRNKKLLETDLETEDKDVEQQEQQYLQHESRKKQPKKASDDSTQRKLEDEVKEFLSGAMKASKKAAQDDEDDFEDDEYLELTKDVEDESEGDEDAVDEVGADDDDDKDLDLEDDIDFEENDDEPLVSDEDEEGEEQNGKQEYNEEDELSDDDEAKLDDILEPDEEEEIEPADDKEREIFARRKKEINKQHINAWVSGLRNTGSVVFLRKLLLGLFVTAHEEYYDVLSPKQLKAIKRIPYYFTEERFKLRILVACLKYVPEFFDEYSGVKLQKSEDGTERKTLPETKTQKFGQVSYLVKSFLECLLFLLDHNKNSEILSYTLMLMKSALPYFNISLQFKTKLLKSLLNLLGYKLETVRFRAFLLIREISVLFPKPFVGLCMKGVYFTLVKNTQQYDQHNYQIVDFLKNCVVEIFGYDIESAYHHAFLYIRELAITLKRALTTPTKQAVNQVYNWRFFSCLDAWQKVVCTHKDTDLGELLYPVTQIILGISEVNVTPVLLPGYLKAISMLNQVAKKSGKFIPVASLLLPLFNMYDVVNIGVQKKHAPNGSFTKIDFMLKVPKNITKTKEYQVYLHEEIFHLLLEYLSSYSHNVAFPEVAYPVTKVLKKFKDSKDKSVTLALSKKAAPLLKKIKENADQIMKNRTTFEFNVSKIVDDESGSKALILPASQKSPLEQLLQQEDTDREQAKKDRIASLLNIKIKAEDPDEVYASEDDEEEVFPEEDEDDQEWAILSDSDEEDEQPNGKPTQKKATKTSQDLSFLQGATDKSSATQAIDFLDGAEDDVEGAKTVQSIESKASKAPKKKKKDTQKQEVPNAKQEFTKSINQKITQQSKKEPKKQATENQKSNKKRPRQEEQTKADKPKKQKK